jgi:hypothetical protein
VDVGEDYKSEQNIVGIEKSRKKKIAAVPTIGTFIA